jgi:glutaredoxin
MQEIILYTNGCPKCNVLKKKLDEKGIEYQENSSVEDMVKLDIIRVPVLKIGKKMLDFSAANDWVNSQK